MGRRTWIVAVVVTILATVTGNVISDLAGISFASLIQPRPSVEIFEDTLDIVTVTPFQIVNDDGGLTNTTAIIVGVVVINNGRATSPNTEFRFDAPNDWVEVETLASRYTDTFELLPQRSGLFTLIFVPSVPRILQDGNVCFTVMVKDLQGREDSATDCAQW